VAEAHDLAEGRGLVLAEAYMWRHSAQTGLLRAVLPQIRRVDAMRVSFFGILPREVDVRFVPELGGGALLDLGCYCVSAARLVLGAQPDRVYGESATGRGGVDERFAGTLRFGDVTATFQCGFTSRASHIEVYGSDGVLFVPQAFVDPPGTVVVNGDEHRVEPGDQYRAELDDFCAAVRGERDPLVGRDEMLGQARTLDALWRSSETAEVVAL
jgi:predicted dehydrogenase